MTRKRGLDVAVTILMIIVSCLILGLTARSYVPRSNSSAVEPTIPGQPLSLEGAMTAGCLSAPVAVIEYADFQCDACGLFARETLAAARVRYLDNCRVLLAFRHFPISARNSLALEAAEAAACAGEQGHFWDMHDLLFRRQGRWDRAALRSGLGLPGLDLKRFTRCQDGDLTLAQIRLDAGEGLTAGVSATPTLFFGMVEPHNKVRVVRRSGRSLRFGEFAEVIEMLLREVERNSPSDN